VGLLSAVLGRSGGETLLFLELIMMMMMMMMIIIVIIVTPANANYVNIITTSYRRAQCWQNERFTCKAPSTALYAGK
jgi:hypothetical protein